MVATVWLRLALDLHQPPRTHSYTQWRLCACTFINSAEHWHARNRALLTVRAKERGRQKGIWTKSEKWKKEWIFARLGSMWMKSTEVHEQRVVSLVLNENSVAVTGFIKNKKLRFNLKTENNCEPSENCNKRHNFCSKTTGFLAVKRHFVARTRCKRKSYRHRRGFAQKK